MDEPASGTVSAALLIIGNEVLSGRTRDANLQYLGTELNDLGIRLLEARIIPDVEDEIVAAVDRLRAKYDYVFTTGGIGPTHDDITSASVAKAFGRDLVRDPRAVALLESHYKPEDITEARLTMADVPDGCELLDNPVSKAPGFRVDNVYVLPGVPKIMQAIFEGFRHTLSGGRPMASETIVAHVQEGQVGGPLGGVQADNPDVEIGSYPFVRDGRLGVSLVVRGQDSERVAAVAETVRALVRNLGAEPLSDHAGIDPLK